MEPTGPLLCLQQPVTLLYPEPDKSNPCPQILSSHPRQGLPSGLYPLRATTKILHAFHFSLTRAHIPSYLIHLDHINLVIFGKRNKPASSLICNFLRPPGGASSLLCPNFFLRTKHPQPKFFY